MMKFTFNLFCMLLVLSSFGCFKGPGIGKQSSDNQSLFIDGSTDEDGITTGDIAANSGIAQTLTSSAEGILGASVTFEPGSLSLDMSVSIEQGSDIANDSLALDLGFENAGVSSASNALVVSGTENIDADQPFTLKLPLTSTGLSLTGSTEYLVIFYRIKKHSDNGDNYNGVIPTSKIRIEDGKAVFQTKFFGSFQAAYIANEVKEDAEKKTTATILTKKAESVLTPIVWSDMIASISSSGFIFKGSLTGLDSPIKCQFYADANQSAPWDHVCKGLSSPLFIQSYGNNDEDDCNDGTNDNGQNSGDSEVLYGRFICEGSSGRVAVSPWTNKITIPSGSNGGGGNSYNSNLPEVQSLTEIETTSAFVDLRWFIDSTRTNEVGGFYITYQESSVAPINCNTNTYPKFEVLPAETIDTATGEVHTRIFGLNPSSIYSFRVCTSDTTNSSSSSGLYITSSTQSPAISCATGNLDGIGASACVVNSALNISDNAVITGRGSLIIDGGTLQNTTNLESFRVIMGTDIILKNGGMIYGNMDELSAEYIEIGVAGAGTLKTTELGYSGGAAGSQGNGPATNQAPFSVTGAGASHGGLGYTPPPATPGNSYGSFVYPTEAGAGGAGGSASSVGGHGGGFVRILARDTLRVGSAGSIESNGGFTASADFPGSGAGGSVLIEADSITLDTGFSISAQGADGGSSQGHAGGGGRIAIHYSTASAGWTGAILAAIKANGGNDSSTRLKAGGAGTVYISEKSDPDNTSQLIFDNNDTNVGNEVYDFGMPTPFNLMLDLDFILHEVVIKNGAVVKLEYPDFDYSTSVQKLQIYNVQIAGYTSGISGTGIGQISAKGFGGQGGGQASDGVGPSKGTYDDSGSGGGGGLRGSGGNAASNGTGGTGPIGSVNAPSTPGSPINLGSGGAGGENPSDQGGNGGGMVFLKVENSLSVDGYIDASGRDGQAQGGGGSGGVVYLSSYTLSIGTNGKVKAYGGAGGGSGGGGGGGGYLLMEYEALGNTQGEIDTRTNFLQGGSGGGGGQSGGVGQRQCVLSGTPGQCAAATP